MSDNPLRGRFNEMMDAVLGPPLGPTLDLVSEGYRFYPHSSMQMAEVADGSIALTVTSPPYWNSIDYDIHAADSGAWHRERQYVAFGKTFKGYLRNLSRVFKEVLRVTSDGGFCAIVIGTVLHDSKHYPVPMLVTERMQAMGWEFHQDIIWNKVTGGVPRAGSFIQRPRAGYYYPNIMTEYILIFRKPGPPLRGRATALDIDDLFTRDIANNIWHIAPVPPHTIAHPCPFPEELARRLVLLYSEPGDEVLDPFLGSGQTAIAAIRQGRKAVGYDVEPSYLQLTVQRIAEPPKERTHNLLPKVEKIERRTA